MQNPLLNLIKPFVHRDLDTMRELIANEVGKSIDINAQDNSGSTALHWAVRRWYFDLTQLILQKGANPNIKDTDGNSALHLTAIAGGSYDHLPELLLDYGAEVDSRNVGNYTPLHLAAESGYIEGAILLVKKGADVNALTNYGISVLSYGLKKLQREVQNGNEYLIGRCTKIVGLLKESGARE
jgi:ankyrin repeat protein